MTKPDTQPLPESSSANSGPLIWSVVVLAALVLRLAITIRTSGATGDDIVILLDCFGWWRHGDAATLAVVNSSAGIFYTGFHHFIWATLAGFCSFKLGPLVVAHAVLMVAPALLMGRQLSGTPGIRWSVLLALSSPLLAYLGESLLPIWWVALFAGTITLQLVAREEKGPPLGTPGLIIVGVFNGYFCSVYPSLSALTLGVFLWLLLRRKRLRTHAAYLGGCIIGVLPYCFMMLHMWARLNPRLQVGDGEVSPLQLLGSIFRHVSLPYASQRANSSLEWIAWEDRFSAVTPWIWLGLTLFCAAAILREVLASRALPARVQLAACAWAAFVLFSVVTHTEKAYHQAGNLWWISALILPWSAQVLFPRRAHLILTALVLLNVVSLGVMFGNRMALGTIATPLNGGRGTGVSWWMQEEIIEQIRTRANEELKLGVKKPITIRCDEIYYIHISIPKLFSMQYPELDQKVRWVAEGFSRSDFLITRDRAQPNRLRLASLPDVWHRDQHPHRTAIDIASAKNWDKPVQVGIPLSFDPAHPPEFATSDGVALKYFADPDSANRIVWVRLPSLPLGITRIWAYQGAATPSVRAPAPPEEVFDFFEDFRGDFAAWHTVGSGKWEIRQGICVVSIPSAAPDSSTTQLILNRPEQTSGLVEARLRFPKFKAPIDAGVVFASRPSQHGYFWNLTGYGVSALSELDAGDLPKTIASSAWYWKAKPAGWVVAGAEWNGPEIRTWVDGWTGSKIVFDTLNPGETGLGRIGLGVKPGPGTLPAPSSVEFDWVRVRTSFQDYLPVITVGNVEGK